MIGPKEWELLKKEISKLSPILRMKRLKEALVRASDKDIKKEINELILKAESDSIEFFGTRQVQTIPSNDSLEKLVNERGAEVSRSDRNIEEIAQEESSLTSAEVKKEAADYDPNKKTEFYDRADEKGGSYTPVEHDTSAVEFEDNSLNRRKDYVNREEVDFNGA